MAGAMPSVWAARHDQEGSMKKLSRVSVERTVAVGLDAVASVERDLMGQLRELGESELKIIAGGLKTQK
jgi:hypothetical protein